MLQFFTPLSKTRLQSTSENRTIDRSDFRHSSRFNALYRSDFGVHSIEMPKCPKSERSNMHGQPTERLKSKIICSDFRRFSCSNRFRTEQTACV